MNPREKDFLAKKEADPNHTRFPKITSSSSRQWSSHRNPRIVRVSRAFGGKDRHSKVCTVRGLRDRRIRLSVPTAIQLYDLQDRLGLGQPSKVVDWLIDATKHEIDKLPPLPMLPGNFTLDQSPSTATNNPQSSLLSHFLSSSSHHPFAKDLGVNNNPTKEGFKMNDDKEKWIEQENHQEGFGGSSFVAQLSAQNLFPLTNNQSSFPNMPYFHWDPPGLSLSQFGGGYPFANQTGQDHHQSQNSNLSTVIPSSSQLYFCPSAANIPSIIPTFPSYMNPSSMESEWRSQVNNHLQQVQQNPSLLPTTLHLISSPMKSFPLNVNSKSLNSQGNDAERPEKNNRNS